MNDTEAIQRLKSGDPGGLEILMERHQVRAARAAFLITQDEASAQDVVQETFFRIYQRIQHFRDDQPFEPYLLRSIINAALNSARGSRRLANLEEADRIEHLLQQATSVEDQVESAQYQQEILDALTRLAPRQRAVIVQRYYLGMSEQEMAQALDAAPGTVKWLLNVARKQLRQLLGREGETHE